MAVYAIADTHFGHNNIIRYRTEFATIADHDNTIMENILARCGKRDSLYILGDAFVGPDSIDQLSELSRHVEYLHVVLGNHCNERKGAPNVYALLAHCKSVTGFKQYKDAWFSHAPIHPNSLRGLVNVHGHVHANTIDDDRYICVSCEVVNYKPVNMATVLAGGSTCQREPWT